MFSGGDILVPNLLCYILTDAFGGVTVLLGDEILFLVDPVRLVFMGILGEWATRALITQFLAERGVSEDVQREPRMNSLPTR